MERRIEAFCARERRRLWKNSTKNYLIRGGANLLELKEVEVFESDETWAEAVGLIRSLLLRLLLRICPEV